MIVKTNLSDLRAAFFDKAQVYFAIVDKDFNIIDVSKGLLKDLKLKRDQIVGKNLREISLGIGGTKRFEIYKRVMRTGESILLDKINIKNKIGEFCVSIKVFKIGEGIGISALNVTALTDSLDELDRIRQDLEIANNILKQRNAELEEFSFIAAHDLKVPLTNLKSLLKMVANETLIPEVKKIAFSKIMSVVDDMGTKLNVLNNTMAIKSDLGNVKEWVNIDSVINKVVMNLSTRINQSGLVVDYNCSELPLIEYCPIQLYSIVYHLLDNAIKFKNPKMESFVELRTKEEHGEPVLIVSDNGLGFNQHIGQKKIFGLFKRMHSHVDGLGVGLYVVNYIVVAHGGNISVKSKINEGTSFKLCLTWKK